MMLRFHSKIFKIFIFLFIYCNLFGHVKLDFPEGGEVFSVGDTVNIEWSVLIPHVQENWDLYFSPDGGQNWQIIILNMQTSQLNYKWIVPNVLTTSGKIRITMDNSASDYHDTSNEFTIQMISTFTERIEISPNKFELQRNYPNPFNPNTTISYSIPNEGNVFLIIYDALGNEVKKLENGYKYSGHYSYIFEAGQLPSGIYFYRLQAGDFVETKKMILLK